MRPFQIILMGIFGALGIGGLLIFAAFRGFGGDVDPMALGVEVWGTLPAGAFEDTFGELGEENDAWGSVRYKKMDERTFESELVNAIAENRGPDLIVLPHELLASQYPKIEPIPYNTLSVRDFRDTYVDGAEIFMLPSGVYGLPFVIDPLVMYWNRSIFSSAGFAYPPATWAEMIAEDGVVDRITFVDEGGIILRSALAFGEYGNIRNAKEILILLMRQAGSEVVRVDERGFRADLNLARTNPPAPPGEAALRFFTYFANPSNWAYSWNRAMREDREMFLAGDLALYFGFGSEIKDIENGNPNLDYDISEVPQGASEFGRIGYGKMYALAISKTAKNKAGAYSVAMGLTSEAGSDYFARAANLAPARRSVIAKGSANPYTQILFRSSLIARGWLDPDPMKSDTIFKAMVDDVTSGRRKLNESISDASAKLQNVF